VPSIDRRSYAAQAAAHVHAAAGEPDSSGTTSGASSQSKQQQQPPQQEKEVPKKEAAKETAEQKVEFESGEQPAAAKAEPETTLKKEAKAEKAEPIPPQTPEEQILAEDMRKQIAEATDKVKMLQDRLLETHKEAEIMRTRHKREMDNSHKYGITKLAKELLEVADNLQRAQEAVAADALKSGGTLKSLHDGVKMTGTTLKKVLTNYGIEEFNPEGKQFDPNVHEAMFEAPVPGKDAGTIIHIMNRGYTIHDRVLRPARVGVAK